MPHPKDKYEEPDHPFTLGPEGAKVYRLNLIYRDYHLAVGAAAVLGAVYAYRLVVLPAMLALLAVYMIARPFVMAVIVDQSSVTFKGTFSARSLQRSSITAVETKHTGKTDTLILWGNVDEKEKLAIPALFNFDEAWNNWWSTYRDLSGDKPLSLF